MAKARGSRPNPKTEAPADALEPVAEVPAQAPPSETPVDSAGPISSANTAANKATTQLMVLPNDAAGLAQFYNLMFMDRGIKLPPHLVPVVMAAMDKRIPKLLIIIGPGSGKSMLLSVTLPAFMLGQDPTLTILALSAGEALMQGFMSSVMEWIEHAPMWKMLFPKVKPDKGKGWSTEKGLFVTGRKPGDPDASYFAVGLSSKALTGKHARLIISDDLHDAENSASAESCEKVRDLYYRQIIGRADPQGARFIFAGRRWHPDDIYGHLKQSGEYVVMELQAQRDNAPDLYWDVTIPEGLICCLNESAFMTEEEKAARIREVEAQIETASMPVPVPVAAPVTTPIAASSQA